MKYSIFGKTGMKVSAMTLGTWGMGGVGWDVYDDEVKVDAIRAALEEGVNFYDTAPEEPFVTTCIVGTQKRERVIMNAAAFDKNISSEDWARLDEAVKNLYA